MRWERDKFGDRRIKWEDNINMDEYVDWFHTLQVRAQWLTLANTVTKTRMP
jgi:hypothetical protein